MIQGFINKTELNYCSFLRVIFIELLFYCICLSYSGLCLLFLQEFPNFWDKKAHLIFPLSLFKVPVVGVYFQRWINLHSVV